jgi:hypothetical protein
MSLIIARKSGTHIYLVSDTKLTYPQELFPEKALAAPGDGVIKVAIIDPHVCIAFAGNDYKPAEEAIGYCRRNQLLPSEIKKHLLSINLHTGKNVEFILCIGFPEYAIYEIKNGQILQTNSSWIGSNEGFTMFQEFALADRNNKKKFDTIMDEGLEYVMQSGRVPEVNGFKVAVTNQANFFHYKNYMSTKMPSRTHTFSGSGSHIIKVYGTAQEGGYAVSFCENEGRNDMAAIHVRQGQFGVLYEMKKESLLWPTVIKDVDEHEFNDILFSRFGIKAVVLFSSLQTSYFNRGNKCMANQEFHKALSFYTLGLEQEEEHLRPQLLFNSGVALIKLDRINEACEQFMKAGKMEPKLELMIQKILSAKANDWTSAFHFQIAKHICFTKNH